jgi:signal transduction histidine kinase
MPPWDPAARLEPAFSPHSLCLPLDDPETGEPAWVVPLWNDHGCCGFLLLGEKSGGSVYTQEEIEIARAVGERLVDAQAGEEAARRLLALQRRQLAESQALDRRARRAMHDDILPQLHAALLAVSRAAGREDPEQQAAYREAAALLTGAHGDIAELLRNAPEALTPETARRTLVDALRRVVEQELQGAFDRVSWQIEPQAEAQAARLAPLAAEALFYAAREVIRNAARHARPPDADHELHLNIHLAWVDGLQLCIQDNGMGLQEKQGETGGSGQGMILHATLLALAGGMLQVEQSGAPGVRVRLFVPAAGLDEINAPGPSAGPARPPG